MKKTPYPWQTNAAAHLITKKKAILCLDLGSGKTKCSLIAAKTVAEEGNILIICQSIKIQDWLEEVLEIWGEDIDYQIIKTNKDTLENKKITITSVDRLKPLLFADFKVIVGDEFHLFKNHQTQRYKFVKMIVKDVPYLFLITGTPLLSRPAELYTLLYSIEHPIACKKKRDWKTGKEVIIDNWYGYIRRYCDAKNRPCGRTAGSFLDYTGASNLEELREKIKNVLILMTWDDIIKNHNIDDPRPPKTEYVENISLTDEQMAKMEVKFEEYIEKKLSEIKAEGARKTFMRNMDIARQVVKDGKQSEVVSMAKHDKVIELLDKHKGEKVVVFVTFNESKQVLNERLLALGYRSIVHETDKDYQSFINEDKHDIFITSVQKGGTGINLFISNICILSDLGETPAINEQSIARVWRLGQKRPVTVYKIIAEGETPDERRVKRLDKKKQVIRQVIR